MAGRAVVAIVKPPSVTADRNESQVAGAKAVEWPRGGVGRETVRAMSAAGIVAYGGYVPTYRLDRAAITAALGTGGGRGQRAVASFDEDTTSMAVEAARIALRAVSTRP